LCCEIKPNAPELIESGAGKLIGTAKEKIVSEVLEFFDADRPTTPLEVFGDGQTAGRVVRIIRELLE
jgi:UDP-N-acetylglucosamine 2-epimerase